VTQYDPHWRSNREPYREVELDHGPAPSLLHGVEELQNRCMPVPFDDDAF
jgi:hypothetical protein